MWVVECCAFPLNVHDQSMIEIESVCSLTANKFAFILLSKGTSRASWTKVTPDAFVTVRAGFCYSKLSGQNLMTIKGRASHIY